MQNPTIIHNGTPYVVNINNLFIASPVAKDLFLIQNSSIPLKINDSLDENLFSTFVSATNSLQSVGNGRYDTSTTLQNFPLVLQPIIIFKSQLLLDIFTEKMIRTGNKKSIASFFNSFNSLASFGQSSSFSVNSIKITNIERYIIENFRDFIALSEFLEAPFYSLKDIISNYIISLNEKSNIKNKNENEENSNSNSNNTNDFNNSINNSRSKGNINADENSKDQNVEKPQFLVDFIVDYIKTRGKLACTLLQFVDASEIPPDSLGELLSGGFIDLDVVGEKVVSDLRRSLDSTRARVRLSTTTQGASNTSNSNSIVNNNGINNVSSGGELAAAEKRMRARVADHESIVAAAQREVERERRVLRDLQAETDAMTAEEEAIEVQLAAAKAEHEEAIARRTSLESARAETESRISQELERQIQEQQQIEQKQQQIQEQQQNEQKQQQIEQKQQQSRQNVVNTDECGTKENNSANESNETKKNDTNEVNFANLYPNLTNALKNAYDRPVLFDSFISMEAEEVSSCNDCKKNSKSDNNNKSDDNNKTPKYRVRSFYEQISKVEEMMKFAPTEVLKEALLVIGDSESNRAAFLDFLWRLAIDKNNYEFKSALASFLIETDETCDDIALTLLSDCARRGIPEAAFNFGVMAHYGRGMMKDDELAAVLITRAANFGFGKAVEMVECACKE